MSISYDIPNSVLDFWSYLDAVSEGRVMKIKVAIIGATGYTGRELIKILLNHPNIQITNLVSRSFPGVEISKIHKELVGRFDKRCEALNIGKITKNADIAFLALPHGLSQDLVPGFLKRGCRIIDLSADFRLKDKSLYNKWYNLKHKYPNLLKKALYGLPEIYNKRERDRIFPQKELIANPGCYATSMILALAPISLAKWIHGEVYIDAKSGVSGAGRKLELPYHFPECNENLTPYKVASHRHTPEVEEVLKEISIVFVPHLVPINRGILSTAYIKLKKSATIKKVYNLYKDYYKESFFVRIMKPGEFPQIKNVFNTNYCDIGFALTGKMDTLIVISAIDNLIKGASGQAVQNMNLMLGFDERTALA